MKKPRLVLVDDHKLFAKALQTLLEPQYDVVGIVSDGHALLESALLLNPDVVGWTWVSF